MAPPGEGQILRGIFVRELLNQPLDEAIAAMNAEVKAKVAAAEPRLFLAELLCLAGNIERADLQLAAAATLDSSLAPWISAFRQLLRAEASRREVFGQGRVPEFVGKPDRGLTAHLEALVALREGRGADAATLLEVAETQRVQPHGICDGVAFADFRDMNDLTAGFLEVMTGGGAYYWIGFDQLSQVEFMKPQRSRDLIWRRAKLGVRHGPEGEVFIPALYCGSHAATQDDDVRTGRRTVWEDGEGSVVRGLGQACFLVGETDQPVLSLTTLSFAGPA